MATPACGCAARVSPLRHSPYGLGPHDDTRAQSLQAPDQSLSSQHTNHRDVGPLQAVAVGPSEAVVLRR